MNKVKTPLEGLGLTGLVQSNKACLRVGIKPFVYFKPHWLSSAPTLIQKATELAEICQATRTAQRIRTRGLKGAFISILASLDVSELYAGPSQIRINTDKTIYCGSSRRDATHTTDVHAALLWLISQGFLTEVDGQRVVGPENKHLPKAYRFSPKWRKAIARCPFSMASDVTRHPDLEPIEIRTLNKQQRYQSKRSLGGHEAELAPTLELINAHLQLMCKHAMTREGRPITSQALGLRRIFTESLTSGGRWYHPLQNLRKADRLKLRIDDNSLVEVDFTSLHPTMLYTLEGIALRSDPYLIPGFKREDVKTAFTILLNSMKKRSTKQLVASIEKHTGLPTREASNLLEKTKVRFKRVEHYFERGFGLYLQYLDSLMMQRVLAHFVFQLEAPIIPIHDSALVQIRYVDSLCYSLWDAYVAVMAEVRLEGANGSSAESSDVELEKLFPCGIKIKSHLTNEEEECINSKLMAL